MASVEFRNITKAFGKDVVAVDQFCLTVQDGEFMVLVGPSGCGKTTALRMIAGLEEATSGDIFIDDRRVNDVPPKDRDIAMVFQNYALYPHMSVYENIAFGLRIRELKGGFWQMSHFGEVKGIKASIDARVKEVAKMLDIDRYLQRKPRELSGGQRQRVALARAIVRKPKVFLMDEPLSNLDAKLRIQTRAELIRLHRSLGITTIYVTHDQVEAMTMGQRMAIMRDGLLQQCDKPEEVYSKPANRFVGGFVGSPPMNFVDGTLNNGVLETPCAKIQFGADHAASKIASRPVTLGLRPESIQDSTLHQGNNTFTAKIDVLEPLGSEFVGYLHSEGVNLVAKLEVATKLREGDTGKFHIDMAGVHVFDRESGEAIR